MSVTFACVKLYSEGEYFLFRRVLKNRPPPEEPEIDIYKLPMLKSTSTQRQSIHCINGAIGNYTNNIQGPLILLLPSISPSLTINHMKIGLLFSCPVTSRHNF